MKTEDFNILKKAVLRKDPYAIDFVLGKVKISSYEAKALLSVCYCEKIRNTLSAFKNEALLRGE